MNDYGTPTRFLYGCMLTLGALIGLTIAGILWWLRGGG
jgi:hypothetical protein